jgi:hypothetical protein
MATYLAEAPFLVKLGLNLLIRKLDAQPLVKISVYDYLWNNTDPLLKLGHKFAPKFIPFDNVGVFEMVSLRLVT